MKTKYLPVIVLLSLVLFTTFVFLNPTLAENSDIEKEKAQTLLKILENNNMSIAQAFSKLDSQNFVTIETKAVYIEGIFHVTQAANLLSGEDYTEACNEAVVAMKKFEETLRILENALPVEPSETEVSTQRAISLKVNITRTVEHVTRLENLILKAAGAGYDTVTFEKRILEVKQYLENAIREFRDNNLIGATEQLSIAKTFLDELNGYLERLTVNVTASKSENYLNAAEVRISEAKENITLSATLTTASKEAAIVALNNSEVRLANARDKIEENNVDDAIEELEEAKKWEEESNRVITEDSVNSASIVPTADSITKTNNSVAQTSESAIRADITATK